VSNWFCSAVSIVVFSGSLLEHDLFRKPVSLFSGSCSSLLSHRSVASEARRSSYAGRFGSASSGWGRPAGPFCRAIRESARNFTLAAVAEPAADVRATVAAETGARCYSDLAAMLHRTAARRGLCGDADRAASRACRAGSARRGKHVLTEKPMAIRVEQAQAMVRRPSAPA
jgi:hypothetical protein